MKYKNITFGWFCFKLLIKVMILVHCLMYMRYKASVFLSFMTLWIIMHYYFGGHFSQSYCLRH